MPPPVFVGMPPSDERFPVGPEPNDKRWGRIRCGGSCKDDYLRINVYHDVHGRVVVLQQAALNSFEATEQRLGFVILLTGSHRACDVQRKLWVSDPVRFANPDKSAHPRGLAIDVSQDMPGEKLRAIKLALGAREWYQARETTEPWHYSFGIEV